MGEECGFKKREHLVLQKKNTFNLDEQRLNEPLFGGGNLVVNQKNINFFIRSSLKD